jgi:hypothetical protein
LNSPIFTLIASIIQSHMISSNRLDLLEIFLCVYDNYDIYSISIKSSALFLWCNQTNTATNLVFYIPIGFHMPWHSVPAFFLFTWFQNLLNQTCPKDCNPTNKNSAPWEKILQTKILENCYGFHLNQTRPNRFLFLCAKRDHRNFSYRNHILQNAFAFPLFKRGLNLYILLEAYIINQRVVPFLSIKMFKLIDAQYDANKLFCKMHLCLQKFRK